jgi:hypothetical protein
VTLRIALTGWVLIALAGGVGPALADDRSPPAAPASPITGDPQDKTSRPRSPTDSEVLAQCIAREQADHTGMSAKEAASACRQQLTRKRPPK